MVRVNIGRFGDAGLVARVHRGELGSRPVVSVILKLPPRCPREYSFTTINKINKNQK
jgi:hypothetical protein